MLGDLRLFLSGARASFSMYMVELTPSMFLGFRIPRTLLQSLFFVLLAKAAGGDSLARFALIGNAVEIAVFNVLLSMELVIESEKWSHTLAYLIASPGHWLPMLLGKSTSNYAEGLFSTAITLAVLVPVLHVRLSPIDLLRSVPLILITVASASALGWLVGAIALPTRWGFRFCNSLAYLMIVLCGVNVPLAAMHPVIQVIGSLLPVTHGLLAIRLVMDGAAYSTVLSLVAKEILIGMIYATLAWLTFGWRLQVTRQRGSFELV